MNAFKELVTPRNSSVPARRFAHHHSRLPAGRILDNERGIQNSPVLAGIFFFLVSSSKQSLIHVVGGQRERRGSERDPGRNRETDMGGLPGPCILETIWRGSCGTRTRRTPQTEQDSSGASNPTRPRGKELSRVACVFQTHSHVSRGACTRLPCVKTRSADRLRLLQHQCNHTSSVSSGHHHLEQNYNFKTAPRASQATLPDSF